MFTQQFLLTPLKNVPVLCFCSHVDTSPDCSGTNVNPVIHKKYNGGDIVLPNDKTQVIKFSEHVALAEQIGNDIITTDGTTLLGADNKAGVDRNDGCGSLFNESS